MKHGRARLFFLLGVVAIVMAFVAAPALAMPPNEVAIIKALEKRGVIPQEATPEEKLLIYQYYLREKFSSGKEEPGNIPAQRALAAGEKGKGTKGSAGSASGASSSYDANILTILVEFAGNEGGMQGPLHNQIAPPPAGDNTTYWIPDFSREHYETMLFSRERGVKSMTNYYLEQSGGTFLVGGKVYGWVRLPHSEWYYGADSENGGTDDLNGPVWRIVVDAVNAIGDSINWADYDKEDPYDLDGDGNVAEPDGYVDHIQFVHAGVGQEAGGGAQGDDAIWSHSWWVMYDPANSPYGLGGVRCGSSNVYVGPYTIEPEDGTIGVFCHEFGHDLGLPDVYDTIYDGEESAGFYTLMSSGSWLGEPGKPLGTSPSSMGIWEKYLLGFVDPVVVSPGQTVDSLLLKPTGAAGTEGKAIRINLPDYTYSRTIATPYSAPYSWYSGSGDTLDNTLTKKFDLTGATAPQLTFKTWYEIEDGWDYGYVEVSEDGTHWQSIPGNITTNDNPNGTNLGNGITGSSNGWITATFDLSAYAGKVVQLRFRYVTDEAVSYRGWMVDDIQVDAYPLDTADSENGWVAQGWSLIDGTVRKTARNYYLLEYRTATGFDISMKSWYNFVDYAANRAEFVEANPGVLAWYRTTEFTDNWVGSHPWQGFLLLLDSHPDLFTAKGSTKLGKKIFGAKVEVPFRTRLQLIDAAFSTSPLKSGQKLTSWFGSIFPTPVPSLAPVTAFDDTKAYVDDRYYNLALNVHHDQETALYYAAMSMNSVKVPKRGVKWNVLSLDGKAARVRIDASAVH